ncbi:hypothetical protein [Streptomyces chrestomyceticus]|uniref:hypothetical protein n=1 Tax=Streptomyces chrestomyceticus TaxID=68185 RepID=UPI0037AFDF1F
MTAGAVTAGAVTADCLRGGLSRTPRSRRWREAQSAADLMLGDMGGMYFFVCWSCPDAPFAHRADCS